MNISRKNEEREVRRATGARGREELIPAEPGSPAPPPGPVWFGCGTQGQSLGLFHSHPGQLSGKVVSPPAVKARPCAEAPSALARLPPLALEPYLHRPHALAVTPTTPARGRAPLPSSSAAAKLDECAVAEPVGALARSSRSAPAHSLKKKKVMGSSVVTAYPS